MKEKGKKNLLLGSVLTFLFVVWTILIQIVDVRPIGQNETDVGFSQINNWFHKLTGVNMTMYIITDWMGLVPLFVCMIFACVGFGQLVNRKSLIRVDSDIMILGVYYMVVVLCYLLFEVIPVNYRPILINDVMEASYPSSTTLLVITVMPTLIEQANRRLKCIQIRRMIGVLSIVFVVFMVLARLISGVHWFTDIVGSLFLSGGLYCIYKGVVLICLNRKSR